MPLTYVFSGTIGQSSSTAPIDVGVVAGLTSFEGTINYDPETLHCEDHPTRVCTGPGLNWSVTFADYTLTARSPHLIVGAESVSLFFGGGHDAWSPANLDDFSLFAGMDVYLSLGGYRGDGSMKDEPGAPAILDFTDGSWVTNSWLRHESQVTDGYRWDVGGAFTRFEQVPVPGPLGLLAAGLLLAISTRRRGRSCLALGRSANAGIWYPARRLRS